MYCNILELFAKRHSFYDINNKIPLDNDNIAKLIKSCIELYPSSFNNQSARVILLQNQNHNKFWNLVQNELIKTTPFEKHEGIKDKITSFANGYGTILFYVDTNATKQLEEQYPLYASNFANWDMQSNAMLQFMIWTALANNNIGASLQHYNPLIDDVIRDEFNIPISWQMVAQMPFGGISSTPQPHDIKNIDERFIILR